MAIHVAIETVSKRFPAKGGGLLVLDGVSLEAQEGEFLSLIGPSGCGKTTLLRLIGGLEATTEGRVLVRGLEPREVQKRKEMGFVFQDPSLLPWRTVHENVLLPLQVNGGRGREGLRPAPTQGDADALLATVGLQEFARYYPHQLSGGMKQRVALARALVFDPALLLMDEPLGALDELTRSAMRYELLRIWETSRKTVVMVTHSIAEAVLMSDRVAVMTARPGRIADVVTIDLPRPRREGIERTAAFLDAVERIQRLLMTGGYGGPATGRAAARR